MLMTVIEGIKEKTAELATEAAPYVSKVSNAATKAQNFICKHILNYYTKGYMTLTTAICVPEMAIKTGKMLFKKAKSVLDAPDASTVFAKEVQMQKQLQVSTNKVEIDQTKPDGQHTPKRLEIPRDISLDTGFGEAVMEGLEAAQKCPALDLIPVSGGFNLFNHKNGLLSSGVLDKVQDAADKVQDGVDTAISYAKKAEQLYKDIKNLKLNKLTNAAMAHVSQTVSDSVSGIEDTIANTIEGQLKTAQTMYDNAMKQFMVSEILDVLGMLQTCLQEMCTDDDIIKAWSDMPLDPILAKVGGKVTELEKKLNGSAYQFSFSFEDGVGLTDKWAKVDTTMYTPLGVLYGVHISNLGIVGAQCMQEEAQFMPDPYYSVYMSYVAKHKAHAYDSFTNEKAKIQALANDLHLSDEQYRKVFFNSNKPLEKILRAEDFCAEVFDSLVSNGYFSKYGCIDYEVTSEVQSLLGSFNAILVSLDAGNYNDVDDVNIETMKEGARYKYTDSTDGTQHECFTIEPLISRKTKAVPDFFTAYTQSVLIGGVEGAFVGSTWNTYTPSQTTGLYTLFTFA